MTQLFRFETIELKVAKPYISLENFSQKVTFTLLILFHGDTRWHRWLKHYATSRKVVGSSPDQVIEFFQFA
jgi:hypothetical protein